MRDADVGGDGDACLIVSFAFLAFRLSAFSASRSFSSFL